MQRFLFFLSVTALLASLLGGAAVVHQHSVQTFGAVSGLPDPDLAPRPNGLAINVALEQYDPARLEDALDSLEVFHWLRQTFRWDEIEPERGGFDWARWDHIVARVESHQLGIIAVLNYTPEWARRPLISDPPSPTAPPGSSQDFAAFAHAFAARYGETIDVYQVWDEPNIRLGWGEQPPSAAGYAALLQAAYAAIHAADPTATVVAAALAPTKERGPDNVSDLIYLQQLYDLGASRYFDAAAGKPYGFDTDPDDRRADPALLNFSRFALLREVMERNGDSAKLLWGGNFGWNTQPSPWGHVTRDQQVAYTLAAYRRAADEWPWAGPLALENYQPGATSEGDQPSTDDPRWGFALADPTGLPSPLMEAIDSNSYSDSITIAHALPGNYAAAHPSAQYTGDWEFSDLGADIPQAYDHARIEITFQGTDLALKVRRADYRAYLYVTIDGQPANRLPRDARGAYLVLTSPDRDPEVVTLRVASGLAPGQTHTAVIQPERGWDQWAFVGFSVGRRVSMSDYFITLSLLLAVALLGMLGAWRFGRSPLWGRLGARVRAEWERLGSGGQLLLTALVGGMLYVTASLTVGGELVALSRRSGDAAPILITALTAGLFYFSPSAILAAVALAALLALFCLRLDIALAFVALFIPFYLYPRLLWERGFSLVETTTVLALAAWLLRNFQPLLSGLRSRLLARNSLFPIVHLSFPDVGLLIFLLASALSVLLAERKHEAFYEFRTVILDSALFYFLLRATPLDRKAVWRIIDFFLIGAVVVAGYGLYQYLTGTDLITAEGGVARIRSLYGSPNNLALYLGRALPIAVAVVAIDRRGLRRALYALAALVLSLAVLLTFSKGALLLGLPAALAVVIIGWLGRRGWMVVGAGAAAAVAAMPVLSRVPRFANSLDLGAGTSFFRLRLWASAWRMFLDHPLFGVGPDNFLYAYRGWYILPEAWQEPNLSHPHNIALDFLSRVGLLGFAGGAWLIVGFWRTALDTYRRLGSSAANRDLLALCVGLMASMADMLTHGLVDHSFFLVDLAFASCLILALVQQLRLLAKNREERAHDEP